MVKKQIKPKAKVAEAKAETTKVDLTEEERIWDEIKDLEIEMFALPDQKVNKYVKKITIDPSRLFLLASATSVLPALELVVQKKFNIEKIDRYIVISRK